VAITKETTEDQVTVNGDLKHIQIREATVIKEDGNEITRTFHRRNLVSRQSSYNGSSWTHTDTDVSSESALVKAIAAEAWTSSVKTAQDTANEAGILDS
jgi:hypothetical protein